MIKNRPLRKIWIFESEVADLKVDLSQFKDYREASNDKIKKLEAKLKRSSDDVLGQSEKDELLKKSLKSKNAENKNLKKRIE